MTTMTHDAITMIHDLAFCEGHYASAFGCGGDRRAWVHLCDRARTDLFVALVGRAPNRQESVTLVRDLYAERSFHDQD